MALWSQVTKGSISGNIVDSSGALISGATLKAAATQTGVVYQTTSDKSGGFHFNLLPPGTYRVESSKTGFGTKIIDNVVVTPSVDTRLGSIAIVVSGGRATVEVSATTPLIETTQAQVTNTFSAENLKQFVGVNENQGLDYLALLMPGINASRDLSFSYTNGANFESNGNRDRNNDQQIDGQNNNDNTVGGPALTLSDAEFVSEYQIVTNNFGPEYGRNSGSVVNLISKSGSNYLHGSIYGYWTNNHLIAMNLYEKSFEQLASLPRSNTEFSGFTVGFPIVKNRLFFFNGFDEQIFHEDDVLVSGGVTPTKTGLIEAGACPFVNTNALDALKTYGPWGFSTGNPIMLNVSESSIANPSNNSQTCPIEYSQVERSVPELQHAFSWLPRLDYQTDKDTFVVRYLRLRNDFLNVPDNGPAGYFYNVPSLAQAVKLGWTRAFSQNFVNEVSVGWSRDSAQYGGSSNKSDVTTGNIANGVSEINIGSGGEYLGYGMASGLPQGHVVDTWQLQDNFIYQLGRHHLKAGINFTYQRSLNTFLSGYNGIFSFVDYSHYFASQPGAINVADGTTHLNLREYDKFLYAGDDWQLQPNLTLNFGLTWSFYGQPANLLHKIDVAQQASSTPLWDRSLPASVTAAPVLPSQFDLFGPSIGFAWSPNFLRRGAHKTIIRGGYRLSYDPPFYNIYLNMAATAPQVLSQTLTMPSQVNGILPAAPIGTNVRSALSPYLQFGVQDPRGSKEITLPRTFYADYVSSWSLGIQHELTRALVAEARYVGNHGGNLFQNVNANPYLAGLAANFPNRVSPMVSVSPTNGRENGNHYIVLERKNSAWSDYNALQTQLRTSDLFHQLQFTASYTWSKTTDNASEIFSNGAGGVTSSLAQDPLNFTLAEHGLSGLDFPQNITLNLVEQIPFFSEQQGLAGHVLGGWAVSLAYYLASGQPYTPIQYEIEYISSGAYNNPALGVTDYAVNSTSEGGAGYDDLRPFLGSRSAPISQVGAYAGDVCNYYTVLNGAPGASCGVSPTALISFNVANKTGDSTVQTVTASNVRYVLNGPESERTNGTPWGSVARNDARSARTNSVNAALTKNFKLRKGVNALVRVNFSNLFNHPNYSSVDPYLDDAGYFAAYSGFGNPSTTPASSREITFSGKISW
jgi:hypothetical protein